MALQLLTAPPAAPIRGSDSETFINAAEANIAWWSTFVGEVNTLRGQLMATSALIAVAPDYADPALLAIASSGLTPAADRFPYYTGAGTAALGTVTAQGRTFLAAADQAAQRSAIGLGAGTYLVPASNLSDVSNATTARGNLSAAKSGANTDITSLSSPSLGAATATTAAIGTNTTQVATTEFVKAEIPSVLNSSGSAPVFAPRAWVLFDGAGTVAIRASGNVSSISDNGIGDYTINFTTALPSSDYAIVGSANSFGLDDPGGFSVSVRTSSATASPTLKTTSACRVITGTNGSYILDLSYISVQVIV